MLKKDKKIKYEYKLAKVRTVDNTDVDNFNEEIITVGWEIIEFENRTRTSDYTLVSLRREI